MSTSATRGSVAHPSRAERAQRGVDARRTTPLAALAEHVVADRGDPVSLLEKQAAGRVPDLVPLRYGRMAATAFTFYRGAAAIMADDLSRAPTTGLRTQLCGDAHLSNFGIFATPERRLAFDVNDFDETHPGPFDWDVKRLVASLAVAADENGFSAKKRRKITRACAAEYRETMTRQAQLGNLAVWYSHIEAAAGITELRDELDSAEKKRARSVLKKARRRDSVQALSKLTTVVDGTRRIISTPPLVVPIEELYAGEDLESLYRDTQRRLDAYAQTLQKDRRLLYDQFHMVQIARKVVGVGSVGTRTWIILMLGADDADPLFLQVKEAKRSVLSDYVECPSFATEGERVVYGQRLMQQASDIFLGWERGADLEGVEHDFYVRQLRDGKGSALIESQTPTVMTLYGRMCARALAYAHARGGDRIAVAAYLGDGDEFDHVMAEFADTYAEQNVRDHSALLDAIDSRRVAATTDT
ncbi:hypothetical protein CBI38_09360 [Rhodococcus oxybenzonivorans]|uniref:DUF2252 domain-containing protein n=1 Tax=Rhodococcus oxybenzonivorans TaxID=1990687 RepID=A0A2S2BT73_9NOCA|nr:DUF2252 domain-containing protein [Rhodococcus oxybenzonivorans]AWK71768.1 hypothetical protein CBI38_09360 [Rhodococcus oxybenzonivorans]